MHVVLAFLADAATVDAAGKISALGLFDSFHATEFPAVLPQCAFVARLALGAGDVGQHRVRLVVVDADGAALAQIEGELALHAPAPVGAPADPAAAPARGAVVPFLVEFRDLRFPAPGDYAVDVFLDGAQAASVPLVVGGPGVPA